MASLRNKLDGSGVALVDERMLKQMLGRVNRKQEFADLKAGRALAVGRQVPLTDALEQKPDA